MIQQLNKDLDIANTAECDAQNFDHTSDANAKTTSSSQVSCSWRGGDMLSITRGLSLFVNYVNGYTVLYRCF